MKPRKKYKSNQPQVNRNQPVKQAAEPIKPIAPASELYLPPNLVFLLPLAAAVITFAVYHFTLHNQFLDWDDWIYVTKDPYIKSFSVSNTKEMLFHNITANYFHPLTMLSLALNYHFSKLNPEGYYLTNMLLHTANTVWVFILVKTLLESMSRYYGYGHISNIPWIAGFSALLHGIHPMHVESVAWIAERKDVLYSFFYLPGLILYVRYVNKPSPARMIAVVAVFFCSLMSKPLAVSFPLSLFALDVLLKRKGLWKIILEKWPFFLCFAAMGVITLITVKNSGSMALLNGFTLLHKLTIPFYSFMVYATKFLFPTNLCGYYPYPGVTATGWMPLIFYICPVIDAAIVGIPLYLAYRAGQNYFRIVIFGLGFFLANVLFILQFLSAGVAIVCERYSYIGYIGLIFLTIYFIFLLIDKKPLLRVPALTALVVFLSIFAYLTHQRTKVWHNSETLWHDVIVKYPRQWLVPYMNLAQYYVDSNKMDSAFVMYKELAQLGSKEPSDYRNLANIYAMRKEYDKSLQMYAKAIQLDTTGKADTYLDRAVTYSIMGRLDLALLDYNRSFKADSNDEKTLVNRAYAYFSIGKNDSAITDYNRLIRINPAEPSYYFRRGNAELNKGDAQGSINDYLKSLRMQPENNAECAYDLSIAYNRIGDYANALTYARQAKQNGYKVADSYMAALGKNAGNGK